MVTAELAFTHNTRPCIHYQHIVLYNLVNLVVSLLLSGQVEMGILQLVLGLQQQQQQQRLAYVDSSLDAFLKIIFCRISVADEVCNQTYTER